jgi:hypothetical protein
MSLSSSSSSPSRPVLLNRTNADDQDDREPSIQLLATPPDRKRALPAPDVWKDPRKRVKLSPNAKQESDDIGESDSKDARIVVPVRRAFKHSVYGMRSAAVMAGPSSLARLSYR